MTQIVNRLSRALAYTTFADLVHHIRKELTPAQLVRVIHAYSCNMHTPSVSCNIQIMCTKLLVNLVENVVEKCEAGEASKILTALFETCVDKLGSLYRVYQDVLKVIESQKSPSEQDPSMSFIAVEKAKPVEAASHIMDTPETFVKGHVVFILPKSYVVPY